MRLLDRYLLRELLIPLAYCFCGFLVFWVAFEFVADAEDFQKYHVPAADIFRFYLHRLPKLLVDVVGPISLLLSLLYCLAQHTRHHELVAIRAAGVSMARLCMPYVGVGLVFSAGAFYLNQAVIPQSTGRCDELLYRHETVPPGTLPRTWARAVTFRYPTGHRLWIMDAFNTRTFEVRNADVEWREEGEGARHKLLAQAAFHTNGAWRFERVQHFSYDGRGSLTNMVQLPVLEMPSFAETPELIRSDLRIAGRGGLKDARRLQFSLRELLSYRALGTLQDARDRAWLETRIQEQFSSPFTSLVVVLIAIPFGAGSGRRNAFVGVAASLFIGFAYFVLREFSIAAGSGGHLPAVVAAWLPNVVFAVCGLALTRRLA